MNRHFTCIVCPRGCSIEAEIEDDRVVDIKGYACPRGRAYVETELTAPRRMLTTTVFTDQGTLLSVRTRETIPKELLFAAMEHLRTITVKTPVAVGDIVVQNLLGTGVDVVATSSSKGNKAF